MMDYQHLKGALIWFAEDMYLPLEDSLGCIEVAFNAGTITEGELKQEYLAATSHPDFDWLQMAKETTLLINPDNYTNSEIQHYIQWLLQDHLFPEERMPDRQFDLLVHSVMDVLGVYTENGGWMPIDELYNTLKSFRLFHNLEFYELVNVPLRAEGMNIKGKLMEGKNVMGYMKYD